MLPLTRLDRHAGIRYKRIEYLSYRVQNMDFGYAFTYIFEDKQWISKLAVLAFMLLLALIPLVGLVALAVVAGYLLQLTGNVRNGMPRPLPRWTEMSEMLATGGFLLLAMLVYNLPLILVNVVIYAGINIISGGFLGPFMVTLVTLCCALPLSLLYTLLAWSMLAVAVSEYVDTRDPNRFFRFAHLYDVVRIYRRLTTRWVFYSMLLNVGLVIIGWIPCFGQLAVMLLAVPVHGHLLGQYARNLRAHVRTA